MGFAQVHVFDPFVLPSESTAKRLGVHVHAVGISNVNEVWAAGEPKCGWKKRPCAKAIKMETLETPLVVGCLKKIAVADERVAARRSEGLLRPFIAMLERMLRAAWRFLAVSALGSARFVRFDLGQHRHARCLDGSPGGGYIRSVKGSNVVVLSLQGSGYCDSVEGCYERRLTPLGSSSKWKDECPECAADLTDSNCKTNPDFCNATLVALRYCSGDRWLGSSDHSQIWPETNSSFFFAGGNIVRAAVTELLSRGLMKKGSTLLLAGRSAGAIGVFSQVELTGWESDSFIAKSAIRQNV